MATTWTVWTNEQDSSENYAHVRWELDAQHVPHPEKSGVFCDTYTVTLDEDAIPQHVKAYIEITERKFDADRCVEFWQESID